MVVVRRFQTNLRPENNEFIMKNGRNPGRLDALSLDVRQEGSWARLAARELGGGLVASQAASSRFLDGSGLSPGATRGGNLRDGTGEWGGGNHGIRVGLSKFGEKKNDFFTASSQRGHRGTRSLKKAVQVSRSEAASRKPRGDSGSSRLIRIITKKGLVNEILFVI